MRCPYIIFRFSHYKKCLQIYYFYEESVVPVVGDSVHLPGCAVKRFPKKHPEYASVKKWGLQTVVSKRELRIVGDADMHPWLKPGQGQWILTVEPVMQIPDSF